VSAMTDEARLNEYVRTPHTQSCAGKAGQAAVTPPIFTDAAKRRAAELLAQAAQLQVETQHLREESKSLLKRLSAQRSFSGAYSPGETCRLPPAICGPTLSLALKL
jgi:hypothetical protein